MLKFTTGDMFETPAEIRVNTVNCVGVMGAGVALAFKTRYPDMFRDYKRACAAGEVQPGKLHIWKTLTGDWIINFPTKRHWRENSRYEDIDAGLIALRTYLSNKGPVTVALPALGCGHGGLDWSRVSQMIRERLEDLPADVLVFEPADSRAAGHKVLAQQLESEGIKTIPLIGAGTSTWPFRSRHDTVFVRGNTDLLQQPTVAFATSRKPEEREREAATACMEQLSREGMVFAFNYDALLDRTLIEKGVQKGAHFVLWVSEGLMDFRVPEYLQHHIRQGSLALASVVNPRQRWKQDAYEETQVVSLKFGKVGIITEPRPKWVRSNPDGLRQWLDTVLFYLKYKEADQQTKTVLRQVLATPIGRNPETQKPNLAPVLEAIARAKENAPAPAVPETQLATNPSPEPAPVTDISSPRPVETPGEPQKTTRYPKRLIEVDLPIRRISDHARREKSIRHGHISTLHIWWARRPLAACRAVICAALWPDPADPDCPQAFRDKALVEMQQWTAHTKQQLLSDESRPRFERARQQPKLFENNEQLRGALLDFIADFANWDNSTIKEFLDTSRALTQAAHETLGGAPDTRPLVMDPFAGGGSIPLEALRVGADSFASDLNPIPVLLNKVVLEYIPKYGQRLADEVRKWGEWIKQEAEKELAEFYPKDTDGATPIAYLWARTIQCEGPGCGAEVPLIRAPWLVKKDKRSVAFQLVPNPKANRVDFQIIVKERGGWVDQNALNTKIENPNFGGTVKRGSATCPCCGYTTPVARVREQLKTRRGGANDARLICVVMTRPNEAGRLYRLATEADVAAVHAASEELKRRRSKHEGAVSLVPEEPTPLGGGSGAGRAFSQRNYGMDSFADLFTNRQLLAITTLARLVRKVGETLRQANTERAFGDAVQTVLAQVVNKQADYDTSLCSWHYHNREKINHTFHRQAIPIVWDFVEPVFFGSGAGSWPGLLDWTMQALDNPVLPTSSAHVELADAAAHPLPNDSVQAFVTDPPYYDAVPYSDLSDFFYVWFKRTLPENIHHGFESPLTPKTEECIVDEVKGKDAAYFEATMKKAMAEGRRVLSPSGIGIVVFAHKSTAGWEAQLQAMVDGGWIMTGSWPIDTEMGTRLRAQASAALASSVHLVCRPRENPDGSVRTDEIGDWRDVLAELPRRIHEWMPRLADEGVVGADAIFACLGPALEIFSRYSRVEKASGEPVPLKEYLEQVWAAVAKEALTMIFTGADASGFEEDARLTAMWLWTLTTGQNGTDQTAGKETSEDEEGEGKSSAGSGGFALEYDAARKIAQGLGAHLESLVTLVSVEGETARLLPVAERAQPLFGKDGGKAAPLRKKRAPQMELFKPAPDAEAGGAAPVEPRLEKIGATTLDRVHQAMLLFAGGRSEALKRFLVEDAAGADPRFWTLAQALSALYPTGTDEKRWVDGVLARKKGLGF